MSSLASNVEALKAMLAPELDRLRQDETLKDLYSDTRLARFLLSAEPPGAPTAAMNFRAHLAWREREGIDRIRKEMKIGTEDMPRFALSSCPHARKILDAGGKFGCVDAGRSRMGDIVHLEITGAGDPSSMVQKVSERDLFEHFCGYFELRSHAMEAASPSVDDLRRTVQIRDMSRFGLSMIQEASAMRTINSIIKIGVENYPESTQFAIFTSTPKLFSSAWAMMQTWMPERTQKKVRFIAERDTPYELMKYVTAETIAVFQLMNLFDDADVDGLTDQRAAPEARAQTYRAAMSRAFTVSVAAGSILPIAVLLKRGACEAVRWVAMKLEDETNPQSGVRTACPAHVVGVPQAAAHLSPDAVTVSKRSAALGSDEFVRMQPSDPDEVLVIVEFENVGAWWSAQAYRAQFFFE